MKLKNLNTFNNLNKLAIAIGFRYFNILKLRLPTTASKIERSHNSCSHYLLNANCSILFHYLTSFFFFLIFFLPFLVFLFIYLIYRKTCTRKLFRKLCCKQFWLLVEFIFYTFVFRFDKN